MNVRDLYPITPQYGTSMHYPHCIDGQCTGCLPPDDRPAIGVCGFGRCGSSMTMAMLTAGGVMPAAGVGPPSYELPNIRLAYRLPLAGHSVKLLDAPLHFGVPDAPAWRFVWLDRDPVEQAKSTLKLVAAVDGSEYEPGAVDLLTRSYEADRPRALGRLRRHGDVLVLQYERVLANPRKAAKLLRREVWPELDVDAAAAAVHQRDGRCRDDLNFELELDAAVRRHPAGKARGGRRD